MYVCIAIKILRNGAKIAVKTAVARKRHCDEMVQAVETDADANVDAVASFDHMQCSILVAEPRLLIVPIPPVSAVMSSVCVTTRPRKRRIANQVSFGKICLTVLPKSALSMTT